MRKSNTYKITWNCEGTILKDYYEAQNKQQAISQHNSQYNGNIIKAERI